MTEQYIPSLLEVIKGFRAFYSDNDNREPSIRNSAVAAQEYYTPFLESLHKENAAYREKIQQLEDRLSELELEGQSEHRILDRNDGAADSKFGVMLQDLVRGKSVRIHPADDQFGHPAWEIIIEGHKYTVFNQFGRLGDAVEFARRALGVKDHNIILYNRVRKVVCTGLNL